MLVVEEGLLGQTFLELRRCGAGRAECVVVWTGPVAGPGHVDGLLHPNHSASAAGYDVDGGWLTATALALAAERRSIRAQCTRTPAPPTTRAPTTTTRSLRCPVCSRS